MDDEDLVLLILNGLPDEYNVLKTIICARSAPITMDTLCSLLCSEAIHVEAALKQNQASEVPFAYAINRGHYSSRGGHRDSYRGKNSYRCRDGGRSRD